MGTITQRAYDDTLLSRRHDPHPGGSVSAGDGWSERQTVAAPARKSETRGFFAKLRALLLGYDKKIYAPTAQLWSLDGRDDICRRLDLPELTPDQAGEKLDQMFQNRDKGHR